MSYFHADDMTLAVLVGCAVIGIVELDSGVVNVPVVCVAVDLG